MEALLTLDEAQRDRRCRICGSGVPQPPNVPKDWLFRFEHFKPVMGPMIITKKGAEFAHQTCLELLPKDAVIADRISVINNLSDLRKLIEGLSDDTPVYLTNGFKVITPTISLEARDDVIQKYGRPALEIRI